MNDIFFKVLAASTSHITKETNDWLMESTFDEHEAARCGSDEASDLTITVGYVPYGFLISAGGMAEFDENSDSTLPPDLAALRVYARKHQCSHILLDRDLGQIEDLPTYEW